MGISIIPGAGPLGRTVSFSEFDQATQKSTPQVLASGTGQIVITGDGSAQTVFTDSWTAMAEGENIVAYVWFNVSNITGSPTPTVVLKMNTATIDSQALTPGSNPGYVWWQVQAGYSATTGRGHIHTLRKAQLASLTPVEANDNTTAFSSISTTLNPAGGTTCTVQYQYTVVKYATGV